jgi:hypothetical protein
LNIPLLTSAILAVLTAGDPSQDNSAFKELLDKGVTMSDGTVVKLPAPILADGLDAAQQKAALDKVADARSPFRELVKISYYAPVVVKVATVKPDKAKDAQKSADEEGPAIRTIDLWFVAHGDWKVLTSKDFLETAIKGKEEGPSRVVLKSGVLTDKEMAARKLTGLVKENHEERFIYSTFRLFERVEISATRFAVLTADKDSILAAARVDPRFLKDADFPNQWRPLLRDERAEIKPGPAKPFEHAGGYAKITRLKEPANGVLVECHLTYEEPYGWFDGVNLVKNKLPPMVQEKVRTFRRKLLAASGESK